MEQLPIITRQISDELEERFLKLADEFRQRGEAQMLVVAMAATMQHELAHHESQNKIPHADSIELVMRAVEHALRGDPEMKGYILDKLELGADCMAHSVKTYKPLVMA